MSRQGRWLFTSEAVCMGHPDKMADQISDAVLDAIIKDDPDARVACETLVKTGLVMVSGEITTSTYVEIPEVVRQTIKEIGYDSSGIGFDHHTCGVMTSVSKQSADIDDAVSTDESKGKELGAGDRVRQFEDVAAGAADRVGGHSVEGLRVPSLDVEPHHYVL